MKLNYFRFVSGGRFYDFSAYTNQRTGEVIIRPAHNSKGKGVKTWLMQVARSRWGQNVNAYQQLAPFLSGTFTGEYTNRNPFNVFMSLNVSESLVNLTKDEVAQGTCILEDFVIASGKLGEIVLTEVGDQLVSNIRLYGLTEITADTTVSQLAYAIIANPEVERTENGNPTNPNELVENANTFLDLDELYFFRVYQTLVGQTLRISVMRHSVQLSIKDTEHTVWAQAGQDGFTVTHATIGGQEGYYLSCPKIMNTGCAFMHSRGAHGKTVHTSRTQLYTINSYLDDYTSKAAQMKAVNSYGGTNRVNYARPTENTNANAEFVAQGGVAPVPAPVDGTLNGGSGSSGSGSNGGSGGTTPTQVTLTCSVVGSGGTVSPTETTVDQGASVTFTATPASGKRVKRWSTGATGNTLTVTATSDQAYTVEFEDTPTAGDIGRIRQRKS